MTSHGRVTRATLADAAELALNLRPEDRRELEDMTGRSAHDCLTRSVLMGAPAYTLRTHSGDLIAIVSVVPFGHRFGFIGMSGTPLIAQNKMAFLRGARDVLSHIDTQFDTLANVCDARNEAHVRWLRWLGFTFINKIERYGSGQIPAYEFARIANV